MIKRFLIFIILFPCVAFADTILTNNLIGGCDITQLPIANNETKLTPVFEPIEYTCSYGQFLPADTTECRPCPNGYNCNGGTYAFSETEAKGISNKNILTQNVSNACAANILSSVNNTTKLIPVFEPMSITCNPGYYLEENAEICTKCLADNYCPGGTYTFNETIPQGIIECPSAHPFAPAGMWQQSQCGRKLHVGDDVLYMHQQPANPTTHRLYIGHPNGIYSANAVQRDMNSNTFPKMSEGMSKGFHVTIDSVEYLICDDSVPECRND